MDWIYFVLIGWHDIQFGHLWILKYCQNEPKWAKSICWPLPWQRRTRGEKITKFIPLAKRTLHTQSMKKIHFLRSATFFWFSVIVWRILSLKCLTQEHNTTYLAPVGFELSILWLQVRASNHCATHVDDCEYMIIITCLDQLFYWSEANIFPIWIK